MSRRFEDIADDPDVRKAAERWARLGEFDRAQALERLEYVRTHAGLGALADLAEALEHARMGR